MKLWQLKYSVGSVFLSCHLIAAAIIWFWLLPTPLREEDARTLFFIILPLTSFYTISFIKDISKRQLVEDFYQNDLIAPWSGYLQVAIVCIFGCAVIFLLLHYSWNPYPFESLKMRFGILDSVFTGIIGAISENLFGAVQSDNMKRID
jgi:hypothetical protein